MTNVAGLVITVVTVIACVAPLAPAAPPGTRACVGLPSVTCQDAFAEADAKAVERGTVVAGIAILCTTTCGPAQGEAEVSVSYADGTSERYGFGWSSAGPAPADEVAVPEPTFPVMPTCIGLDSTSCENMAAQWAGLVRSGDGEILSIVVRCTAGPCTPTRGDGETMVTFADGDARAVAWSYSNVP